MKNFLFSLQVLIDIILDESPNMKESLSNIIEGRDNLPFVDLDRDFFKGVLDNMMFANDEDIAPAKFLSAGI